MSDARMKLEGSLDLHHAADAAQRFREWLNREGSLELDGSGLTAIDGCGLQLLLAVFGTAREQHREIVWSAPSESLSEAADLMGLSGLLGLKEQS